MYDVQPNCTVNSRTRGEFDVTAVARTRSERHNVAPSGSALVTREGRWWRLVGFAAVGAAGAAVNTCALALLTRDAHVWYLIASVLATQIAILFNFTLTEWLVFRRTRTDKSLPCRFASYLLINDASLLFSGPLLLLLVALGTGLLLANALVLGLLCLGRFAIADSYIWGGKSFDPRRIAAAARIG